jgi:ABC-type uncharacterized transport system ATPase subunit
MKKYKIIGFCGEAGAGKDRVLHEIMNWYNEIFNS